MTEHATLEPLAGLRELEMSVLASAINQKRFVVAEGVVKIDRPTTPDALDIGARAVALATIMDFYNTDSRVAGSAIAITNPESRFCRQYNNGSAANVQHGAEKNRRELLFEFRKAVGALAAVDALRANGYDEADSGLAVIKVQRDLNAAFGAGSKATAIERNEVVKKARRLAEATGVLDKDQGEIVARG